jgi:gamma-glutamyl hydrolase
MFISNIRGLVPFASWQPDLHQKVTDPKLNIIIQNHEYGVPPSHHDRWPILKEYYNVLTTTKDRNGLEYISTIEAKKYPFTGVLGSFVPPSVVDVVED